MINFHKKYKIFSHKILSYIRITKLATIVPPVAIAEINFNGRNNSYHGAKAHNIPDMDCKVTAITRGIFRPILKLLKNLFKN